MIPKNFALTPLLTLIEKAPIRDVHFLARFFMYSLGSNQRPVQNMVALLHCRLHYSLFSPNSLSFHLSPAAVEFVPVNAATRLLIRVAVVRVKQRGKAQNKREYQKVLSFILWLPLLGSNQRQRG